MKMKVTFASRGLTDRHFRKLRGDLRRLGLFGGHREDIITGVIAFK